MSVRVIEIEATEQPDSFRLRVAVDDREHYWSATIRQNANRDITWVDFEDPLRDLLLMNPHATKPLIHALIERRDGRDVPLPLVLW